MTNERWPQEVRSFYEDLSLSDDSRASIVEELDGVLRRRKWRRIAGGLAAVVVFALCAYAFVEQDAEMVGSELVAVKINNDDCGKCQAMGNVFAELQQELEGRQVLFLTFDVSDSVTRGQSVLLGDTLGIKESLEGIGTGTIVLFDRHGQLLEKLDGTSGKQYLASQIARRL